MKVLFTTPMLEHPARSGPHLRVENSIKALLQVSELHILSRVPEFLIGGKRARAYYQSVAAHFDYISSVKYLSSHKWFRRFQKVYYACVKNEAKEILQYANKHQIDVIWFGFGNISYSLIKQIHEQKTNIPIICDTDSVWSRFIFRELPFVDNVREQNKIVQATLAKEQEEKNWVQWCQATLAVSEVDAQYYRNISSDPEKIFIFPNAIDLDFYNTPVASIEGFCQPAVILSGSFGKSTSPMNRAADWVLADIWPRVLKQIPNAHLYIVGNYSDVAYANLQDTSITVAGRVPSILPYLKHATVAITPLQFESGTRFKILEAGACHLPMVSTTLGAEGLAVRHEEDILIADTSEAFAQAIVRVIQDRSLAEKIAQNNYALVKNGFGIDALVAHAKNILQRVVVEKAYDRKYSI